MSFLIPSSQTHPRGTPQVECDQERHKTTRPSCESVSRSRPRYRLPKSSSPVGHAPTRNRANQFPSTSVGCGHVHPCCRPVPVQAIHSHVSLNTVGQQPPNFASIHPQFLKGRIRQPCSDQQIFDETQTQSLETSGPRRRSPVCAPSWLPTH